ncbi:MAG: hypothetical protein CMF51_02385 [Legionellales bacterium]|nr:hypothetical protein [Legionellales bacterium]|tara:strand:+ start:1328 stop:1924 length:597 start_codon:yes stop_codon:yes gene_type:complete
MALSKIQAESMNLADTFAFTGTVSGAGSMEYITTASGSTDVSQLEISVDYSDYEHFVLIMDAKGDSTGTTKNLHMRFKRDGQSTFDSAANNYSTSGFSYDGSANRNQNGITQMEIFWSNEPAKDWAHKINLWNIGNTTHQNFVEAASIKAQSSGNASYVTNSAINGSTNSNRIISLLFFYSAGNIASYDYQLYGIKTS